MADAPWDQMSTDEKLNWLRAELARFADIGDQNAAKLDSRERDVNARLAAVEAALQAEIRRILHKTAD
jgi:hypothetical protein